MTDEIDLSSIRKMSTEKCFAWSGVFSKYAAIWDKWDNGDNDVSTLKQQQDKLTKKSLKRIAYHKTDQAGVDVTSKCVSDEALKHTVSLLHLGQLRPQER
jgi:hypothetical protein